MRAQLTRDFYIPKHPGTVKVTQKDGDGVAYLFERPLLNNGTKIGYFLIAFHGKANKPDLNFYYNTPEAREKRVKDFFEGRALWAKKKEEQRAKRKSVERVLQVGDILYSSWGYEQTNIDFYQVVGLKGNASVVIRKLAQIITCQTGYMSENVIADKNNFISEPFTKRDLNGAVKIESHAHATKWDGYPLRQSHYH